MENKCKKCYHDKRGIYHHVYSSCARNKHKKSYRISNYLNNYLSKLPEQFKRSDMGWVEDDMNCFRKWNNEFLKELYEEILLKGIVEDEQTTEKEASDEAAECDSTKEQKI